ncbi:hypothetical protein JS562_12175 [Agrobacterium sp. S2]|nr:hypothetical protein [Agrobacterium sp. S2]
MSDKPEQAKPAPRKTDRLFYAVLIGTILYFVAGFMLFEKFLNPGEYLEFYKWNALGDFLAGVFAPLAFIWLVAAVIIQREELKSSRQQFDESQTVIQEQLDYIRDQSAKADAVALRDYKLALFDPRIEIYKQLLGFELGMAQEPAEFFHKFKQMEDIKSRSKFLFGDDVEAWLEKEKGRIFNLFIASNVRVNGVVDADGNYDIAMPYRNRHDLDNDFHLNMGAVLNSLSYESINKKLLPYLKVYEDTSVSVQSKIPLASQQA